MSGGQQETEAAVTRIAAALERIAAQARRTEVPDARLAMVATRLDDVIAELRAALDVV